MGIRIYILLSRLKRIYHVRSQRNLVDLERLLEKLSFEASDIKETKVIIDAEYVDKYLNEFAENEDLSRYIL